MGQCLGRVVLASDANDNELGEGSPESSAVSNDHPDVDPSTDAPGTSSDKQGPEPFTAAAADARMLKIPMLWVISAGLIVTVISTILLGSKGLIAGVLGTVVVTGFFGGGQYIVARVLRNNPMVAMNMAMLVYVGQMAIMFLLLLFLRDATFFNPKAFAITVVVCAFVWTGAMAYAMMRTKVLYVEPGSGPGQGN